MRKERGYVLVGFGRALIFWEGKSRYWEGLSTIGVKSTQNVKPNARGRRDNSSVGGCTWKRNSQEK